MAIFNSYFDITRGYPPVNQPPFVVNHRTKWADFSSIFDSGANYSRDQRVIGIKWGSENYDTMG